jgi:hypothetical protein
MGWLGVARRAAAIRDRRRGIYLTIWDNRVLARPLIPLPDTGSMSESRRADVGRESGRR